MVLTTQQEDTVREIMAQMACPKDSVCYEEKFEGLCPANVYGGADIVQCLSSGGSDCPMSYAFSGDVRFCKCRLRRYVALELGR